MTLYAVCMSAYGLTNEKKNGKKDKKWRTGWLFFSIWPLTVLLTIFTSEQREGACFLDNNESSLRCAVKEVYKLFTYLNHYSINNSYISSGKCYT